MTRKNLARIFVGLFIAAALLAVMFSYQVRHNERAVVETLGTLADDPIGPGLYFRWPWPIQKITKYDIRTQFFKGSYDQLQTSDQRNLLVGLHVCWRIQDPILYRTALGDEMSKGEAALRSLVTDAKGSVIGATPIDSFASLDPAMVGLVDIEQAILAQVKAAARDRYGIDVLRVGVERTSLPEDVTTVVMENERKKRIRDAQNARSQGEAQGKAIISEAETTRRQILSFATLRAHAIRARGTEAATAYYQQYGEDEELAMFLRRLEYLKSTLNVQTLFVLDGSQYDVSHGWFGAGKSPAAGLPEVE